MKIKGIKGITAFAHKYNIIGMVEYAKDIYCEYINSLNKCADFIDTLYKSGYRFHYQDSYIYIEGSYDGMDSVGISLTSEDYYDICIWLKVGSCAIQRRVTSDDVVAAKWLGNFLSGLYSFEGLSTGWHNKYLFEEIKCTRKTQYEHFGVVEGSITDWIYEEYGNMWYLSGTEYSTATDIHAALIRNKWEYKADLIGDPYIKELNDYHDSVEKVMELVIAERWLDYLDEFDLIEE